MYHQAVKAQGNQKSQIDTILTKLKHKTTKEKGVFLFNLLVIIATSTYYSLKLTNMRTSSTKFNP